MKVKVELELFGFNDEGEPDDDTQAMILSAISTQVKKEVADRVQPLVEAQVGKVADDAINVLLARFLENKVTVTDQWGHAERGLENISIEDLLRKRFERFWEAKVNKEGRETRDNYGSLSTRMEWLLDRRVSALCEKFSKDLAEKVEAQVKSLITDKLKATIGGSLIDSLGVPEIMRRIEAPQSR